MKQSYIPQLAFQADMWSVNQASACSIHFSTSPALRDYPRKTACDQYPMAVELLHASGVTHYIVCITQFKLAHSHHVLWLGVIQCGQLDLSLFDTTVRALRTVLGGV